MLEGRSQIAVATQEQIQDTLDEYGVGITITKVNLQDTNFPSQVEAAVQDAIKAREDKERLSFEAQSYSNDILPKARGEAARRSQDAEAYKAQVIADAEGEASRFEQLLAEYQKAPSVTRERLYIEAIEEVYSNSNKVLLDAAGSGNLLYLPIDKLIEQGRANDNASVGQSVQQSNSLGTTSTSRRSGDDPRARRGR